MSLAQQAYEAWANSMGILRRPLHALPRLRRVGRLSTLRNPVNLI